MDAIGFDVYGTLVDPFKMAVRLQSLAGDRAERLAELWRAKQLEYSFRRAAMKKYEDFGACTKQALIFAAHSLKIDLTENDQEQLIEEYQNLAPYAEVLPAMVTLRAKGHSLVAFSNGVEATVRDLLHRAGVLPQLDGVVSVDDLKTFKPDPRVYAYLAERLGREMSGTWLVSSNA